MTTEQIDSNELATLREKARLYDEAKSISENFKTINGRDRYRVEKTGFGFWPFCVRAGNGTRELFVGHKKSCDIVASELATAFEDGKFVAAPPKPAPQSLDTARPGVVPDVDVVVVTVSLNGWSSVKHIPLLVVESSNIREVARFADQAWADVKSAMESDS